MFSRGPPSFVLLGVPSDLGGHDPIPKIMPDTFRMCNDHAEIKDANHLSTHPLLIGARPENQLWRRRPMPPHRRPLRRSLRHPGISRQRGRRCVGLDAAAKLLHAWCNTANYSGLPRNRESVTRDVLYTCLPSRILVAPVLPPAVAAFYF
jgi:hypothetical protein